MEFVEFRAHKYLFYKFATDSRKRILFQGLVFLQDVLSRLTGATEHNAGLKAVSVLLKTDASLRLGI